MNRLVMGIAGVPVIRAMEDMQNYFDSHFNGGSEKKVGIARAHVKADRRAISRSIKIKR
jgi:hypothetical protein